MRGRVALCLILAAGHVASTRGNIDLLFRPAAPVVFHAVEDEVVQIRLIARSDSEANQSMSAMDAILVWNPQHLRLLGVDSGGAGYVWFFAGFMPDPDGINSTFEDGDALFTALARPGVPAQATPAGLVVTTLRFRALETVCRTELRFIPTMGQYGRTRVFDGAEPNREVTGDISSRSLLTICGRCEADLDCDCDVDQSDLGILLAAWQRDAGGDLDADGDTDQSDLGILLAQWHCGVP